MGNYFISKFFGFAGPGIFDASPENTVLIAGLPRSGTTLVCSILTDLPGVVALNEPMEVRRLAGLDEKQQVRAIYRFASRCRRSLIRRGKAPSLQVNNEIPGNMFSGNRSSLGLREIRAKKGYLLVDKKLPENFLLAMKHNLGFAAIMPVLSAEFRCYGIIRNPLAVLASWQTVDTPLARGHAPVAEMIDTKLKRSLEGIRDVTDRQIHILNWHFDSFRNSLPANNIIRYEEIVRSGGNCLEAIVPGAGIRVNLASRNNNPVYDAGHMHRIGARLLDTGGPFLAYYSEKDVNLLLDSVK